MFMKMNIFKIDFDESVKDFKTRDGIISILYYIYILLIIYLFGLLMFKTNIYKTLAIYFNVNNKQFYEFIFYIPIMIIEIAPIFILIKIRKQNIKSIGLRRDKNLKSVFLGVIFSLPFVVPSIINAIVDHRKVISSINFIWLFFYFLIEIAFVEELGFRGFIQTRIQSLIKIKWLSIVVVGIMFALMHIPFQMLKVNMPIDKFIISNSFSLITTFAMHIYFVYLYTRDNNIVSSTVAHTLTDLIPFIFI